MKKIIFSLLGISGLVAIILAIANAKRHLAVAGTVALVAVQTNAQTLINGAGSTFDYPAFTKWFEAYGQSGSGRPFQLSVHRLRRRTKAIAQPDGGLRRFRRADEG